MTRHRDLIPHTKDPNLFERNIQIQPWDLNPKDLNSNPQAYKCIITASFTKFETSSLSQRLVFSLTAIFDIEGINTIKKL